MHMGRKLLLYSALLFVLFNLFSIEKVENDGLAPSLASGDYVWVSHISFGFRFAITPIKWPWSDPPRYSDAVQLPYWRIGSSAPNRGDIVLYNEPTFNSTPTDLRPQFIARVEDVALERGTVVDAYDLEARPEVLEYLRTYEAPELELIDHELFLKGFAKENYTVSLSYYELRMDEGDEWIDSRHFGWVPETHIIGEIKLVPWSVNKDGVQWGRIFARP